MIVTSEAVVLRTRKFRETSVIATLYTRAFGKVSMIAKGARQRKGRFGSALQPMNFVKAVFYWKETKDLHLLSQCDLVEQFSGLSDNLERMAPALSIVELVDLVAHSEEENGPLFALLVDVLRALNSATKNTFLALYYFEMKLLDLLGFRPELRHCVECGRQLDEKALSAKGDLRLSPNGLVCHSCAERGLGIESVKVASARVLQRLQELKDVQAALRIGLTPAVQHEVSAALRRYLEIHVEGLRRRKTEAVFSSIT